MTTNLTERTWSIFSQIQGLEGCEPYFVNGSYESEEQAQRLCDLLNESGGTYIHYWAEPVGVKLDEAYAAMIENADAVEEEAKG